MCHMALIKGSCGCLGQHGSTRVATRCTHASQPRTPRAWGPGLPCSPETVLAWLATAAGYRGACVLLSACVLVQSLCTPAQAAHRNPATACMRASVCRLAWLLPFVCLWPGLFLSCCVAHDPAVVCACGRFVGCAAMAAVRAGGLACTRGAA